MKNAHNSVGVRNMSDLVLKQIYGKLGTKKQNSKKQTQKYKMTYRVIYKKYDNLNVDKLNTDNNKNVYVKNDVMTTVIKRCRREKKRGEKNR